jgi:hypothetical protein
MNSGIRGTNDDQHDQPQEYGEPIYGVHYFLSPALATTRQLVGHENWLLRQLLSYQGRLPRCSIKMNHRD